MLHDLETYWENVDKEGKQSTKRWLIICCLVRSILNIPQSSSVCADSNVHFFHRHFFSVYVRQR